MIMNVNFKNLRVWFANVIKLTKTYKHMSAFGRDIYSKTGVGRGLPIFLIFAP